MSLTEIRRRWDRANRLDAWLESDHSFAVCMRATDALLRAIPEGCGVTFSGVATLTDSASNPIPWPE